MLMEHARESWSMRLRIRISLLDGECGGIASEKMFPAGRDMPQVDLGFNVS